MSDGVASLLPRVMNSWPRSQPQPRSALGLLFASCPRRRGCVSLSVTYGSLQPIYCEVAILARSEFWTCGLGDCGGIETMILRGPLCWAGRMTLKPLAICLVVASALLRGGAFAEDAGQATTKITANYGVYWAGLRFGDVHVVITVRGSRYKIKGNGQFSVMGGLIYEWRGNTASAGKLIGSGPEPSLYTLSYSGGDKHGDVRITFSDGAVSELTRCPPKSDRTPRTSL